MVMYAGLTDADKAAVWTRLHADTWSGLQAGGHRFDPGRSTRSNPVLTAESSGSARLGEAAPGADGAHGSHSTPCRRAGLDADDVAKLQSVGLDAQSVGLVRSLAVREGVTRKHEGVVLAGGVFGRAGRAGLDREDLQRVVPDDARMEILSYVHPRMSLVLDVANEVSGAQPVVAALGLARLGKDEGRDRGPCRVLRIDGHPPVGDADAVAGHEAIPVLGFRAAAVDHVPWRDVDAAELGDLRELGLSRTRRDGGV